MFDDLDTNEWKDMFDYGTVYGKAKCSDNYVTQFQSGIPSETEGGHCWCILTNFVPTSGAQCAPSFSTSWIYFGPLGDTCASHCAHVCSYQIGLGGDNDARRAVYGLL